MRPIKAKFKKRERELTIIIQRILEKMENNTLFPNPPAALAELKKLLPEIQTALSNAEGRDKAMVSIKNDKKASAFVYLQEVADYVTTISKGDRTIIFLSGFEVNDESRKTMDGPSVQTLEVELGLSGEATIRTRKVEGVKAYVHQYCTEIPGPNTLWVNQYSSQGIYTFKGLTSEKRHWFRVIAIGFNEQLTYSPVVAKVIQ